MTDPTEAGRRRIARTVNALNTTLGAEMAQRAVEAEAVAAMVEALRPVADADGTIAGKIRTYAGPLIRAVAHLSVDGPAKHAAVRAMIKAAIFGDRTPRDFIDDEIFRFKGLAEIGSDLALKVGRVNDAVDRILDIVIRATYSGMKTIGAAL